MKRIKWINNRFYREDVRGEEVDYFSEDEMRRAFQFHSSMPAYTPTPLHSLTDLSKELGVGEIYVKDEGNRFGLQAFKGLGASYAMASYFANELALDLAETPFLALLEHVKQIPVSTVATVTAGNHGKGVAWVAKLFGQQAKVYMPKGTSSVRVQAVKDLGAEVFVTEMNYDDTVIHVAELAATNGWILMQDTAWDGYETIPRSIMQGYTTIVGEIVNQLQDIPLDSVTHVFLQAGVGSFAASMATTIYHLTEGHPPKISIVEPSEADCIYESANHLTGKPHRVHGDLATMMAGLACGEPSPLGWNVLQQISDYFFSCADAISAQGMRLLAHPVGQDISIVSGASGSVPIGLLYEVMTDESASDIRNKLELNETSRILVINTEGATDPEHYKKIVHAD